MMTLEQIKYCLLYCLLLFYFIVLYFSGCFENKCSNENYDCFLEREKRKEKRRKGECSFKQQELQQEGAGNLHALIDAGVIIRTFTATVIYLLCRSAKTRGFCAGCLPALTLLCEQARD